MAAKLAGTGASGTRQIPTGSKATSPGINGTGSRKCHSWIESFIKYTADIDSPEIFRRWVAIGTIAAALEQKVWAYTTDVIYPNLYTFIIGHPGVGKSRTINAARKLCDDLPDFFICPQSVTSAALVDALKASRRTGVDAQGNAWEFCSMTMFADEWAVTISDWKNDLVAGLTTFYDVGNPYLEGRRQFKEGPIKIKFPQLNIIAGTTPSQLLKVMPEGAWDQGFASRTVMVFSDERNLSDDIFRKEPKNSSDLLYDLNVIHSLYGQCSNSQGFMDRINGWIKAKQPPVPNHPKLLHYNSRRLVQLIKMAAVSCVDRGDKLLIEEEDFARAFKWLIEAEATMPSIFQAGAVAADSKVMDEIMHMVIAKGEMSEGEIIKMASKMVPAQSVRRIVEIMVMSNMIRHAANHPRYGTPIYRPCEG